MQEEFPYMSVLFLNTPPSPFSSPHPSSLLNQHFLSKEGSQGGVKGAEGARQRRMETGELPKPQSQNSSLKLNPLVVHIGMGKKDL